MLVSEAISRINYALRGIDDDAPVSGTDDYTYWLSVLNRKKDEFYRDVRQLWAESYEVRSMGTISASAAPSFDLDEEFIAPSDSVYAVTNDDDEHRTDYRIVKPSERTTSRREAFIAGLNPKVLYFTNEIITGDNIIGATLYVPGYYMPDDMSAAGDELPFPDPNWAVMASAAEIAFNDIVYETKAPDLNEKANSLYRQIVQANRRGTYNNPRQVPTNTYRIRSPRYR